jgi:hypothetical protein
LKKEKKKKKRDTSEMGSNKRALLRPGFKVKILFLLHEGGRLFEKKTRKPNTRNKLVCPKIDTKNNIGTNP